MYFSLTRFPGLDDDGWLVRVQRFWILVNIFSSYFIPSCRVRCVCQGREFVFCLRRCRSSRAITFAGLNDYVSLASERQEPRPKTALAEKSAENNTPVSHTVTNIKSLKIYIQCALEAHTDRITWRVLSSTNPSLVLSSSQRLIVISVSTKRT